jgi:hypothetical protein
MDRGAKRIHLPHSGSGEIHLDRGLPPMKKLIALLATLAATFLAAGAQARW